VLEKFLRRAALAVQANPTDPQLPPLVLLLGELRSLGRLGASRAAAPPVARARHPRSVMLMPGFMAHPLMMYPLAQSLGAAGHHVSDWGLSFNIRPTQARLLEVARRVERLSERRGEKIALIGWSLGGLYAREVARLVPAAVHSVITLGAPFSGDRRANRAWRVYPLVTGDDVDSPPIPGDLAVKPPVTTIALWSPRDGIIAPRSACGRPGERDRAVALRCTHVGFVKEPAAIAEVMRQLDRED
jgi:pimeloyl-ACP methyl ester carboxylesterase